MSHHPPPIAAAYGLPMGQQAEAGEILAATSFAPRVRMGTWQDADEGGLSASRIVATAANGSLVSVPTLTSWIAETPNQLTVTDDGDGTVTLALPQNIHTAATPQFAGVNLGGDAPIYRIAAGSIAAGYSGFTSSWVSAHRGFIFGTITAEEVGQLGIVGNVSTNTTVAQLTFHNAAIGSIPNRIASISVRRNGANDTGRLDTVIWVAGVATTITQHDSAAFQPGSDNTIDSGVLSLRWRDVYAGRQFLGADGSASSPGWSFSAATGWGIHRNSGLGLLFDIAGVSYGAFATDGFTVTSGSKYAWSSGAMGAAQDLILSRVSAGTGKVTNGASTCEWRVHGGATKHLSLSHSGSYGQIITDATGGNLILGAAGSLDWYVAATGHHFLANSDNAVDIGASGATRPRTGYFGTALAVGTNPASDGLIRLANDGWIKARNAANGADVAIVRVTSGDVVQLNVAHSAIGAETISGFLTIVDDGGVSRKVAVVS